MRCVGEILIEAPGAFIFDTMSNAQEWEPEFGRTSSLLWTVADWRCELHDGRFVRLLKDGQIVSEQLLDAGGHPDEWGSLWRAAVVDVEAHER